MGAHTIPSQWALIDLLVADPGASGNIHHGDKGFSYVPMTSAGAESRTLKDPTRAGLFMALHAVDQSAGNITVTADTAFNSTGNNTIIFADDGDFVFLMSVRDGSGGFRWQEVANPDGILSTV